MVLLVIDKSYSSYSLSYVGAVRITRNLKKKKKSIFVTEVSTCISEFTQGTDVISKKIPFIHTCYLGLTCA